MALEKDKPSDDFSLSESEILTILQTPPKRHTLPPRPHSDKQQTIPGPPLPAPNERAPLDPPTTGSDIATPKPPRQERKPTLPYKNPFKLTIEQLKENVPAEAKPEETPTTEVPRPRETTNPPRRPKSNLARIILITIAANLGVQTIINSIQDKSPENSSEKSLSITISKSILENHLSPQGYRAANESDYKNHPHLKSLLEDGLIITLKDQTRSPQYYLIPTNPSDKDIIKIVIPKKPISTD